MSSIKPEHIKKFKKHCRALYDLLEQIRETEPGANYYLANEILHLMSGPTHDEKAHPLRENSVAYEWLGSACGGGDW